MSIETPERTMTSTRLGLSLDKSTWTLVRLGEVVKNVNRKVKDPAAEGLERIVAMEHLDPGEITVQRSGSLEDGATFTRHAKPGQTLFGKRRAYQRKAAFVEFEAVCSGDILTFEAIEGRMLPEFLPFVVQSDGFYEHALGTSAGSLSPRTNWRDLKDYKFTLPPLDEQEHLADLLWSVERHRRTSQTEVHEVNVASNRLLSDILDRPKQGWRSMPITDLVSDGPRNGKSAPAGDPETGVPTLSISTIRNGRVLGGKSVKYMDVDADSVSSLVLQEDDFLVVRGNGNRDLTALGGLVKGGLPEGCVYPDLLIRLRFDSSVILPEFAAVHWNHRPTQLKLLTKAKSTNGIWKVNGRDIKSHALTVPTITEQRDIIEKLDMFQTSVTALRSELDDLFALRSAILAETFEGA